MVIGANSTNNEPPIWGAVKETYSMQTAQQWYSTAVKTAGCEVTLGPGPSPAGLLGSAPELRARLLHSALVRYLRCFSSARGTQSSVFYGKRKCALPSAFSSCIWPTGIVSLSVHSVINFSSLLFTSSCPSRCFLSSNHLHSTTNSWQLC